MALGTKLYPPEKALHDLSDVTTSNFTRRVSTVHEWPWLMPLISATKVLHPIACAHPDTLLSLSLLLSAWYRSQKKSVLRVCICRVYMQCCWPNGCSYYIYE